MARRVFVVLGLWWLLTAIGDVLRDLHVPGSIAAVSVPDVLHPMVFPQRAAELLRVWEDWDSSLGVSGLSLRSDRVVTWWLAVDVCFALALGRLLRGWTSSRLHRLRRALRASEQSRASLADPIVAEQETRVGATIPLLDAAARMALLYVVFDVLENLTFFVPSVLERGVSGWLNVAYVLGVGKWLALAATVLPIAVSYLVTRNEGRSAVLAHGARPHGVAHGYVQTLLDLRAQVLAVGLVCAALLLLPANVRPQIHDIIRGWRHQWPEAATAVCGLALLMWLTWWTGQRTLRRVESRGDIEGMSLDGAEGKQRIVAVVVTTCVCAVGAVALWKGIDQGWSLVVVVVALGLWLASCLLDRVRTVTATRPAYERRPGVVRVLTFLPLYALAVAWMRAEIGRIIADVWTYRLVVTVLFLLALNVLWSVVARAAPPGLEVTGEHWGQGMRAASHRLWRREIAVPLVCALGAAVALLVAASELDVSWAIGAVGMIVLGAIILLGVVVALTGAFFGPPRGALALLKFTRFPVVACLLLVAVIMSLLVDSPGFHKARVEPAIGTARLSSAWSVRPVTTPADALDRWRVAQATTSAMDWAPLVVVASSGGGGRAAYWTLIAFDCLFGDDPQLADEPACARGDDAVVPRYGDVFAASGISGGAVGIAMYTSEGTDLEPDQVFEDGFVDPVVANLLTRDVPNMLFHAPGWRDRAAWLEEAFENKVSGLERDFLTDPTAEVPEGGWEPVMVLNSAAVEDGCRVVLSNVSFGAETATDPLTPFTLSGSCRSFVRYRLAVPPAVDTGDESDAVDTAAHAWPSTRDLAQIVCSTQNLATSTAALLSARFPYVSPSGAVEFCADKGRFTYLVDGGTVDSSGAAPAALMLEEIVRRARSWNASRPDGQPCVQPIVLQLDNGYEDVVAKGGAKRPSELIAPIQGGVAAVTNNAETARQQLAVLGTQLRQRAGCEAAPNLPTYLQVYPLSHPGTEAPLGWALSQDSREDLKQQLGSDPNQCSLLALRYWMTGSAGPGVCITGTVTATSGSAAQQDDEPPSSPRAVANRVVCLPDPADSAGIRLARTNAYGVFVHVHSGGPLPANPTPITSGERCDGVTPGNGASYGVPGQLALGYELTAETPDAQRSAGWNFFVLVPLVLAAVLAMATAGGGVTPAAVKQERARRRTRAA